MCAVLSQHQNLIDSSWASRSLFMLRMSARICLPHKNDSTGLSLSRPEHITLPHFITIKGLTCLWYVKWSVGEWTRCSWTALPLFLQIVLFRIVQLGRAIFAVGCRLLARGTRDESEAIRMPCSWLSTCSTSTFCGSKTAIGDVKQRKEDLKGNSF